MQLIEYRKTIAQCSRAAAGKFLGVLGITVWRWETGKSFPEADALQRIEDWSGGKVQANDMLETFRMAQLERDAKAEAQDAA